MPDEALLPIKEIPPELSLEEVLSAGWQTMLDRFWGLSVVLGAVYTYPLLLGMVALGIQFFVGPFGGKTIVLLLISLAAGLLNIFIALGTYSLQLNAIVGDELNSKVVFEKCTYRRLWNYCLCTFMSGFFITLGYIFLIVPGVYIQLSIQFAPFFIIEKDLGPIEALKASWIITENMRLKLFFLSVINKFIVSLGGMLFFVGAIPATVMTMMTNAHVYRTLLNRTDPSRLPYEQLLLEAHRE